MHRRALEIGQIHTDLRQVAGFEPHSHRLHTGQSPGGRPNLPGNIPCYSHIRGFQIDVERDQKLARSHRRGARRGVQLAVAEIGKTIGIGPHQVAQSLESTAADIFQIDAVRPPRRRFVEVNRHPQTAPDLLAGYRSQSRAGLQRDAAYRNERHNVRRADPRVDTGLTVEIDRFHGARHRANRRLLHSVRGTGEGDDGTVVIRVERHVQDGDARHGRHGGSDGVHFALVPSLGEIGYAFNERSGHGISMVHPVF